MRSATYFIPTPIAEVMKIGDGPPVEVISRFDADKDLERAAWIHLNPRAAAMLVSLSCALIAEPVARWIVSLVAPAHGQFTERFTEMLATHLRVMPLMEGA